MEERRAPDPFPPGREKMEGEAASFALRRHSNFHVQPSSTRFQREYWRPRASEDYLHWTRVGTESAGPCTAGFAAAPGYPAWLPGVGPPGSDTSSPGCSSLASDFIYFSSKKILVNDEESKKKRERNLWKDIYDKIIYFLKRVAYVF